MRTPLTQLKPASHVVHAVDPDTAVYDPLAHVVHDPAPPPLNVPAEQAGHDDAPAAL